MPLNPQTWQNSGSLNQCWLTFVEKCLRWRTTSVATDREIFLVTKNGCRPSVVLYIWKRFLHRITVIQINGFCCWCVFCALLIFKSIFFFSNNKKGTRKKGGPIFDCIIGKVPKNCKNAFSDWALILKPNFRSCCWILAKQYMHKNWPALPKKGSIIITNRQMTRTKVWVMSLAADCSPHFLLELHSSRLTLIGGFRLFRLLILTYWFLSVMSVSIWSLVAFKLAPSINQRNLQHFQKKKKKFFFSDHPASI